MGEMGKKLGKMGNGRNGIGRNGNTPFKMGQKVKQERREELWNRNLMKEIKDNKYENMIKAVVFI
jgi:hypothetical protein